MRIDKGIVAVLAVLIILLPVGYSVLSAVFSQTTPDGSPFLAKPEGADRCVRDTTYMRFHHMDFLKELRNQAAREGIRGDVTIAGCRDCHTNRKQFCNRCHDAVNLHLDCFRCHYYPLEPEGGS